MTIALAVILSHALARPLLLAEVGQVGGRRRFKPTQVPSRTALASWPSWPGTVWPPLSVLICGWVPDPALLSHAAVGSSQYIGTGLVHQSGPQALQGCHAESGAGGDYTGDFNALPFNSHYLPGSLTRIT